MPIHSLTKRFSYKLATNAYGVIISFITQMMVPRALGPIAYGSFSYLTNFFGLCQSLLDMGTADFFSVNYSRTPNDRSLPRLQALAWLILFAALALGVGAVLALGWQDYVWPDQITSIIILSLIYANLDYLSQQATNWMDAAGLTVQIERIRILQKTLSLLIVAALFFSDSLTIYSYFFYHYAVIIFLSAVPLGHLFKRLYGPAPERSVRALFREMVPYASPLAALSVTGLLAHLLDRWLLQTYSGSVQQGFFSLAQQAGTLCFLFSSAFTPLLAREYSIAFHQKSTSELKRIYSQFLPLFYFIATYIACGFVVYSREVVLLVGGKAFAGAQGALLVMALFPIHQTYGRMAGVFFHATDQTRLYRNISIPAYVLSSTITWLSFEFLLPYFPNGSLLLAIKLVAFQWIQVNVYLYFGARYLSLGFAKLFWTQISTVAICLGIGYVGKLLATVWLNGWWGVGLGVSMYLVTIGLLAVLLPQSFGIQPQLMDRIKERIGSITT